MHDINISANEKENDSPTSRRLFEVYFPSKLIYSSESNQIFPAPVWL